MGTPGAARRRHVWVTVVIFGVLAFNVPWLMIFDRPLLVFGLPLLPLYLMVAWAAAVALLVFHGRSLAKRSSRNGEG